MAEESTSAAVTIHSSRGLPAAEPAIRLSLDRPWDTDGSYGDWSALHEIGHALGESHVPPAPGCRSTSGPYASYPYPEAIIGGTSGHTDQFAGFDTGDLSLSVPPRPIPSDWKDNMSYCNNKW